MLRTPRPSGERRRLALTAPLVVTLALPLAAACTGGSGESSASATATTAITGASATATTSTGGTTTSDSAASESTTGAKLDLGPDDDLPADTGECVASSLEPQVESIGVDVIIVVDTSNSMQAAIAAVENSINDDFAQILEGSGVDYRVIVLGDYPPGAQQSICIRAPLSATDCAPPPAIPAVTERYKHYDNNTGSGAFLDNILAWYTSPDPHGLAPQGWQGFLREDSRKVFLAMTDGNSASGDVALGEAFDAALLGLQPPHFGAPGDRNYVFHAILSMPSNDPPTEPWLPDDPIAGQAGSIQQVAILSGGWRFPLALSDDFDVLFNEIAADVVDTTPIACSFAIPEPPPGETLDLNTVEIDYYVGGQGEPIAFHQVPGLGDCEAEAFYIDGDSVVLCPEACAVVQGDLAAKLDVRYGCDVGYIPG
ncbi:MAG: hypothetical protein R3A79_14760 [Nannocystaceae bacterium]